MSGSEATVTLDGKALGTMVTGHETSGHRPTVTVRPTGQTSGPKYFEVDCSECGDLEVGSNPSRELAADPVALSHVQNRHAGDGLVDLRTDLAER